MKLYYKKNKFLFFQTKQNENCLKLNEIFLFQTEENEIFLILFNNFWDPNGKFLGPELFIYGPRIVDFWDQNC